MAFISSGNPFGLEPPSGVSQQPIQPMQGLDQPLPAVVSSNPSEDSMYMFVMTRKINDIKEKIKGIH